METDIHSFALVYRNLAAVRRTVEWFSGKNGRLFNALTDARSLVEACTDWDALRGDYQRVGGPKANLWRRLGGALFAARGDDARSAGSACFHWDRPFGAESVSDVSGKAITRLDIDEITAVFPSGTTGPFGAEVRRLSVPRRWLGGDGGVADPYDVRETASAARGDFIFSVGGTRLVYDATGVRPEGDGA